MSIHLTKAPRQGARDPLNVAPNAALLIDFDNVTMGMRSDLSKELKTLLNSDIIKGKVTVQRAYADWRRYPQYIVPLSEASIDLIFAPAYGSNKKNATDIRMAIDGIELVFIRPEIGTFILLTGDSDFSSLVLKLKEYGKYVIGVGIQESSSDILVQNCDEYYSYTSLSGLRKTTDSDRQPIDPWVLVERAVEQMVHKNDVMRSDRLKQVMVELDPGFDEGEYGFSKFSRFLTVASSKGLLHIKKLDNGQYEVAPAGKRGGDRPSEEARAEDLPRSEERGRGRGERDEERRPQAPSREAGEPQPRGRERAAEPRAAEAVASGPPEAPLQAAYDLLRSVLERMCADGKDAVRDSDVKRKMLELDADFNETNLGFSKFSRFLRQAHDHEVIELHKRESGNFEVSLRSGGPGGGRASYPTGFAAGPSAPSASPPSRPGNQGSAEPVAAPRVAAPEPRESALVALGRRLGLLSPPKRSDEAALSVQPLGFPPASAPASAHVAPPVVEPERQEPQVDASELGLPTDTDAQVRYLTNSYKGVGKKTAEALVEGFGEELFTVLQKEPQRVQDVIPAARAENVIEQWKEDFDRRRTRLDGAGKEAPAQPRRERRSRGGRGGQGGRPRRERGPGGRQERPGTDERESHGRPQAEPASAQAGVGAPEEPRPGSSQREWPTERAEPSVQSSVPEPRTESAPESMPAPPLAAPAPHEAAGPPGELEGLDPSRLHTRTKRRGPRR